MQEELSNLQSLQEHAGWKMLMQVAEGQIGNRLPNVLGKLSNLLEAGAQEFDKGEISGIQLFTRFPVDICEDLVERIDELEKELNYGNAERTAGDPSGRDTSEGDPTRDGDFDPPV